MKRKPVSAGDTHYQAERHFQKSSAGQLLVPKTGSGPVGGGEVIGRLHSGPCVLDPDHEGPCMTQEDVDNDCPACGNTHGDAHSTNCRYAKKYGNQPRSSKRNISNVAKTIPQGGVLDVNPGKLKVRVVIGHPVTGLVRVE